MTPEGRVKAGIKRLLDSYSGMYVYMPVPSGFGAVTIDYIGCFRGVFFAIEAKADGKKPTKRQEMTLSDISAAGGQTFVIREEGEQALRPLRSWLDYIDRAIPHDPNLSRAPRLGDPI